MAVEVKVEWPITMVLQGELIPGMGVWAAYVNSNCSLMATLSQASAYRSLKYRKHDPGEPVEYEKCRSRSSSVDSMVGVSTQGSWVSTVL